MTEARTNWVVQKPNGCTVSVRADYHTVEGGVLTFRNYRRNAYAYPVPVMTFAPGHWATVSNLSLHPEDQ